MRLQTGVIRNNMWDSTASGKLTVSEETAIKHAGPNVMVLFTREQGQRFTSGNLFLFQFPPQQFKQTQAANVGVTQTRHGYVVQQGAMKNPVFEYQGHNGWSLRTVSLPPQLVHYGLKSNAEYDRHLSDVWLPLPFGGERGQESTLEKLIQGDVSLFNFQQTLDGRQAWHRMADIVLFHSEENQKRMATGRAPLELVLLDVLHDIRWVVMPEAMPELERTRDQNGVWPYRLRLIGVYDDSRPRVKKGDSLWN